MRVLIAMETSGVTREAFRAKGVDAFSCDLLPAEDSSPYHRQEDASTVIESAQWDLIIMHPTCTKLCVSGNHVYAKGKPRHQERLDAVTETCRLWNLAIRNAGRVCMENPVGVLTTQTCCRLGKPQYVQPYEFGEDASKKTALFLCRLSPLTKRLADRVQGRIVTRADGKQFERWANQTDSGQNRLGPSETRWKERSRTYQGIANAMAEQWI